MTRTTDYQEVHNDAMAEKRHAIVIGGSMSGMLSARILSGHFDRVTIIERDRYPETPAIRPGVPQAGHLHVLLARGQMIIEGLFPGFTSEMLGAGAHRISTAREIAWLTPAGWGVNFDFDVMGLSFSRVQLDHVVRGLVGRIPNISVIDECEVTGLSSTGDTVDGVTIRYRPTSLRAGEEETLSASLVVDAGGRKSKLPKWLVELGYDEPEETVINSHIGYATRIYEIPETHSAWWKAVFIQAAPPEHPRAGVMFPIEGGRWLVTLAGGDYDYPPTDEAGYLEFAAGLRSREIHDSIRTARPLTEISAYRSAENRRRHYDKLANWPENLIVMGDSACAFNPVYGQGMTTAAIGALLLDECLTEQRKSHPAGDLTGMARIFQKRLSKANEKPWDLSTTEDYRYRKTDGGRPGLSALFKQVYVNQILKLSTHDIAVRAAMLKVQGMIAPPATLFHPGIVFKVLKQALLVAADNREQDPSGRKASDPGRLAAHH